MEEIEIENELENNLTDTNNLEENDQLKNSEIEIESNDNDLNVNEESDHNQITTEQKELEDIDVTEDNKSLNNEDSCINLNPEENNQKSPEETDESLNIIEKEIPNEEIENNTDRNSEDHSIIEKSEENENIQIFIESLIDSILETIFDKKIEEKDYLEDNEYLADNNFIEYHEVDRIDEMAEPEETNEEYNNQLFDNMQYNEEENTDENKDNEEFYDKEEKTYEDEIQLTREELIQELKTAQNEEKSLLEMNTSLQHKIGNLLRKKKVEQTSAAIAEEKGIIDFDQKYNKQMDNLRNLIKQYEQENVDYSGKIEELQNETKSLEEKVKEEKEKFQNYRFLISQKAINTRTGKPLSPKDLEIISSNEERKEIQVVETRLISIRLQNEVNKIDSILKSKEELADGLHLIDFEQFKIENQSYNEKLEERTEDLQKLRKKITSNVHILTHVKEKLEFIKYECDLEQKILIETEERLSTHRDQLTSLKQNRDKLRSSNQKLKKSCGMLGNSDLLRNYEDCVDTVEMQKQKMNEMKNKQINLTLRNQALQMKIENTKTGSSNG